MDNETINIDDAEVIMKSDESKTISIGENSEDKLTRMKTPALPSAMSSSSLGKPSGSTSIMMTTVKPPSNELRCKQAYNWLLHLHYVRGEYDFCCDQINRIECTSEYSWYLKGLISLRDKGNVKEALGYFNQIKSLSNVYYIKAVIRCLLLLGRHTEVSEVIRETGLRMAPNDWQLWFILGNCYFHSGNIPLAKDAYQHSLQNSNTVEPFLLLAQCHSIEGDSKSAIFVLRRAAE